MMLKLLQLFIFIFYAQLLSAQKVRGKVVTINGELLPYASISIKGTTKGTTTNSQGQYSLNLSPGQYTLVCQYVNYKKEEKSITVSDNDNELNFVLGVQELTLGEVIVKKGEDPAYEIIRKAIKKRAYYNNQVDSFAVDVYIKGLVRSRGMPQKIFGKKIEHEEDEGLDSMGKGILFLSETMTKVSFVKPGKIKYRVLSSRVSGDNSGFGLSFPFFINFYDNNVQVAENLNPRGFISPIAEGAMGYYKYKYEGSFYEDNKMVNTIKVIPRRKNEPLFSGTIQIIEDDWRIYSLDLVTTKLYSLELADTLHISQLHAPVNKEVWKTKSQVLYASVKFMGFDLAGNFVNVYTDYNINPGFAKKHFDRILMKYDTAFNKKDSAYWSQVRPVTLEPDEKRDFVFKDSVRKADQDSFRTVRNIDSLRKAQKPITLKNLLFTGGRHYFYGNKTMVNYSIRPLVPILEYNTVEGLALVANQSLRFYGKKSKFSYFLDLKSRYGVSNEHFNTHADFTIRPRKTSFTINKYLRFSGGRRISQFNPESPVEPLGNSLLTLFWKRNYMKIYENWFAKIQYNLKSETGFRFNLHFTYEDRSPLENTSGYAFFKSEKTFTPNHPYELAQIPFERHQALVAGFFFSFQPGQRYIQFPAYKVSVGSKYPTFALEYNKGIDKLFGSDVDFDKWKFSVYDDVNLKLRGLFRYKISVGGFLNDRKVEIPDYQHFNGNQLPTINKYLDAFQLAPYYKYSNTESFYTVVHAEHHFNGLLTNKIPLFNKLKWHLVAGTNAFYVNRNNYYVEAFAGIENIFKIWRVDFINAYQPDTNYKFAVKVGAGGLIGSRIKFDRDSVSF